MAIGAILGVAQAGMGIASAIGGYNDQAAQARAQNEALKQQYKQQLRIWDKGERDKDRNYATKLGQYDLGMKAADKAAAAAYGAVDFNRSERTKQATAQLMNDYLAMAKKGGSAAAAGKTGNNAASLDASQESNLVRKEQYRLASLLSGDAADMMKRTEIGNQLEGQRNALYSQVAINPSRTKAPIAPTQVDGPSQSGMLLGIGSSLIQGASSFSSMMAPDPGNIGDNSYYGTGGQYGVFDPTTIPGYVP